MANTEVEAVDFEPEDDDLMDEDGASTWTLLLCPSSNPPSLAAPPSPRGPKVVAFDKRPTQLIETPAWLVDSTPSTPMAGPVLNDKSPPSSKLLPPPPPSLKRTSTAPPSPKDAQAGKRPKTTIQASGEGGDMAKEKDTSVSGTPWRPNFITPNKKHVLASDSLQTDPSIAFTLLSGLALPRDIQRPETLKKALNDCYYHSGRATQSIMSVQRYLSENDKAMKLLRQLVEFNQSQAEKYKKSLQESDTERQKLELQVTTQSELISGLQGAADQARAEGRKEMEGELEAKLKEVYDDILDQILEVEAELKAQQHIESFKLGYIKCLDDAGVGSEDERRASIEVPPLVVAESGARESTEKAADASNEQAPSEQPQSATPSPEA